MPVFCTVDDKHVPLCRIVWVSDLPHFCGAAECQKEGLYEIRLEQGEIVWANKPDHDAAIEALEAWLNGSATAPKTKNWSRTMSTFEDGRFRWRETYFVLFPAGEAALPEAGREDAGRHQQALRVEQPHRRRAGPLRVAHALVARGFCRHGHLLHRRRRRSSSRSRPWPRSSRNRPSPSSKRCCSGCGVTKAASTCSILNRFPRNGRRKRRAGRVARSGRCWQCSAPWPKSPAGWPSTHSRERH